MCSLSWGAIGGAVAMLRIVYVCVAASQQLALLQRRAREDLESVVSRQSVREQTTCSPDSKRVVAVCDSRRVIVVSS